MCGIVPGPGWFGLSREKEAAGAARRMPLPMGFECRSFGDGSGKTGARRRCECPFGLCGCAEHVRQLEGESPFHNLMEVK